MQDSVCLKSGMMVRLLLVNSEGDSKLYTRENTEGLAYRTTIPKYFVLPWAKSQQIFVLILILLQLQLQKR